MDEVIMNLGRGFGLVLPEGFQAEGIKKVVLVIENAGEGICKEQSKLEYDKPEMPF